MSPPVAEFTLRDAARGMTYVVGGVIIALAMVTLLSTESCGDDREPVTAVTN